MVSENTFIPTPQRAVAIIQLCLTFTVLLFILGYPFMGKHYILKSRLLIIDSVIQSSLFDTLPPDKHNLLLQERDSIKLKMGEPFMVKVISSIKRFANVPQFKQAWIVLSIVIALLILLKVEGATLAVWILPLLALAYALDNHQRGWEPISSEAKLFPSEQLLEKKYLGGKLTSHILRQREELLHGWHLYLIYEWAKENPSADPLIFKEQVAKGEFAFNLNRASFISRTPITDNQKEKESVLLLALYISWNAFFAWFVSRRKWMLCRS